MSGFNGLTGRGILGRSPLPSRNIRRTCALLGNENNQVHAFSVNEKVPASYTADNHDQSLEIAREQYIQAMRNTVTGDDVQVAKDEFDKTAEALEAARNAGHDRMWEQVMGSAIGEDDVGSAEEPLI